MESSHVAFHKNKFLRAKDLDDNIFDDSDPSYPLSNVDSQLSSSRLKTSDLTGNCMLVNNIVSSDRDIYSDILAFPCRLLKVQAQHNLLLEVI